VRAGAGTSTLIAQDRSWYLATDPKVDYHTMTARCIDHQDRKYRSNTQMAYLQDRTHLLDDKVELDIGHVQHFSETYQSPVEFVGDVRSAGLVGLLPKVAALYR